MNNETDRTPKDFLQRDRLITALAEAVEARLESYNVSQAALWLAGFVVGRLAAERKGLGVNLRDGPFFVDMFDSLAPEIEDAARTREAGG